MSELLVVFACFNHTGCQETSSQYYQTHPEFREFAKSTEDQINQAFPPLLIQYGGPIVAAAAGMEATARLSTNFYFTCKSNANTLMYKFEY